MDKWEIEAEATRRSSETFRRIHRLVKQGYRPDWTITDVEDAIWFDHPGPSTNLHLYPDGTIVARSGVTKLDPQAPEDHDRIYNNGKLDGARFDRWLATVPLPTWRERTRADRDRFIYKPGCVVLFFAVSLVFGEALEWLWKALSG